MTVTSESLADYKAYIISAFEEDIQNDRPRNAYIIIKDKEGKEIMQIGLAESFSTPLTSDYISLNKINEKLHEHLTTSIATTPPSLAQTKK